MDNTKDDNQTGAGIPLVSVGLAVYNGENYLRQSIESILDQTFDDYELIISDNCSSDGTEAICREMSAKSDKIRYFRQSENLGAAGNFEFTFQQSRAKYFKWHCHDDYVFPQYLEKCVARLEAEPDAVLCQSHIALVDAKGDVKAVYAHEVFDTTDPDPVKRFAGRLRNVRCAEVFGVMPRHVLEKTERLGPFISHDRCLLAQLTLMGRFLVVPEPLFAFRVHPEQYTHSIAHSDNVMSWYSPGLAYRPRLPRWTHLMRCVRYLGRVDLDAWTRLRGYGALLRAQINLNQMGALLREAKRLARYVVQRIVGKVLVGRRTA